MAKKKVLTEDEAHEMVEQYYQRPLGVRVVEEIARRYAGIYGLLLGFSPTNFLSLAFLRINIIFLCLPIRN